MACFHEVYLLQTSAKCTGHRRSPRCSDDVLVSVSWSVIAIVRAVGLSTTIILMLMLFTEHKLLTVVEDMISETSNLMGGDDCGCEG